MAATPFVDLSTIDLKQVLYDKSQIYERLPHRYEFMQLDAIIYFDREAGLAVARRDVREDEFWVKGHIPGRPIMPGVLMIESAAHMASFFTPEYLDQEGFMGFAGVDLVKFRGTISPPSTMYINTKTVDVRRRRTIVDCQGVVDDKLVFEGRITGILL